MQLKTGPKKSPSIKPRSGLALAVLFAFFSCQTTKEPSIVQIGGESTIANVQLLSLTGRRDGDRLPARAIFKAGLSTLRIDLDFRIGVPTDLESGHYQWEQPDQTLEGSVRARSVTFLGGQSDLPNLGGVFELLSGSGSPLYKVTLPTRPVEPPEPDVPGRRPLH